MFCLFPPGLVHRPNIYIGAEVIESLTTNPADAFKIALVRCRPLLRRRARLEGDFVSLSQSTKVSSFIRHGDNV
jgi:hypothetical protein